jgi:copper transport protein
MNRRWTVIGLSLLAVLAGVLAGPASPAYAHAQLVGTTPANGAHLDSAPAEIVLRFSERVMLVRDGIRLLDSAGVVRVGGPARIDATGREAILPVPAGLGDGAYTVSWRIVSADSHPIHGAFVFGIGDTRVTALPDAGANASADTGVSTLFWLLRWLGYTGLAGLAGGALFLFVCWPAGWAQRRARRVIFAGWVISAVSAVSVLLIQGPYANGGTLASLTDLQLLTGTFGTDFGRFVAVRIALLAAAGILLAVLARRTDRPQWTVWVALALGAMLPMTWIGTGHANADASLLARLADTIHLAAMATWFGGLTFLAAVVLPHTAAVPVAEVTSGVTRFSRIATMCVGLLAATGAYQALRGVGSVAALAGSGYGRLLVFKLAAVGVLLWIGWMSRAVVRARYLAAPAAVLTEPAVAELAMAGGPRRPTGRPRSGGPSRTARRSDLAAREQELLARRRLRSSVWIEVAIGTVVLAITALLVATPPGARPAAAADGTAPLPQGTSPSPTAVPEVVASQLMLTGGGRVYVQLEPARVGSSTLVLTVLDSASKPWDVPEVTAALRLAAQDIGPLPVKLRQVRPGDYISEGLVMPMAGPWQLQITIRTSDFDQTTVDTTLTVY